MGSRSHRAAAPGAAAAARVAAASSSRTWKRSEAQPGPPEERDAGRRQAAFRRWLWFIGFVVAACVIWPSTLFTFKVKPNQLGVVLRFGEYVRQQGPGLHFRLPYPVEEVSVART